VKTYYCTYYESTRPNTEAERRRKHTYSMRCLNPAIGRVTLWHPSLSYTVSRVCCKAHMAKTAHEFAHSHFKAKIEILGTAASRTNKVKAPEIKSPQVT
jgi:hypothetical protein